MKKPLSGARFKRTFCLAGVLWLWPWLAACAWASAPTPTVAAGGTPTRTLVTIVLWHSSSGTARTLFNTFAADFHRAYPWITVRVEPKESEGDLLRQGIAAIALNQTPDLIVAGPRTIAEFARRDALIDLNPYFNDASMGLKPEDRADWIPGALEPGRWSEFADELPAWPFDEQEVVLYSNLDLLQAEKIAAPPRTWDAFSEAALGVTMQKTLGWVMSPDAATLYAMLYSRGGRVLDDRQKDVQFDQPAGMATLQLIAVLSNSGAAYLVDGPATARRDFAQGRAAFWFGSTSDLPRVAEEVTKGARFRWTVGSIPQDDPLHPATAFVGSQIALFRARPERAQAAWLLARWLTGAEPSAQWSRTTLAVPVRESAQRLVAATGTLNLHTLLSEGMDTLPASRIGPTIKDADRIDAAVTDLWTAVAKGTAPATAMSQAVSRARRALGQTP